MTYVVTATWRAKPGEEAAVLDLVRRVAIASRQEPGCILFRVHRSRSEAGAFFLYEEYVSEAAFLEHAASDHVRTLVLEDAVNRLDARHRELFDVVPLDGAEPGAESATA